MHIVIIPCVLFSLLVNRLSMLQAHQGKVLAHKMHAGGECAKNYTCVCTYVEVWNTMNQLICHTYATYMPYIYNLYAIHTYSSCFRESPTVIVMPCTVVLASLLMPFASVCRLIVLQKCCCPSSPHSAYSKGHQNPQE